MQRIAVRLFLSVVPVLLALSAAAEDWPQWRGPKRDGISVETGLAGKWASNGPPVLWMTKGLGGGFSSVSVAGNRIYTMGDGPSDLFVHALDRATGKIIPAVITRTAPR